MDEGSTRQSPDDSVWEARIYKCKPERKNGKRQMISTDVVQGAACVLARSERGAAHTRAGGEHGSVTSARGAGRGQWGVKGAPHYCILRAPIFARFC
ncbi:unnamed protein product [Arctia plantaginis]|uniref:Uncharacterized protein n=1 Tax=Arctia plantaginis TaxID=874455 RepID=A0A8S0YQ21_ARCPL|nr:unnamed protein product [Arctia plantaginis]CAB3243534.1 unnamed protein product [Arctia plantaginis]